MICITRSHFIKSNLYLFRKFHLHLFEKFHLHLFESFRATKVTGGCCGTKAWWDLCDSVDVHRSWWGWYWSDKYNFFYDNDFLPMRFMTEKCSGVIPGVMGLRGVFLFLLPCLLPLRSVKQNPNDTDENCVTEYGFTDISIMLQS